jgi:hydrogenase expression/formation protein HypE
MIGKVPPDLLEALILSRTGASDERVLQGPAYGEDTAAIRLGEEILVVNPDPISLAVGRVGTLGVNVACNDIAASGATPEWLTSVIFLPGTDEAVLDTVTRQLDEEATRLGVSIVGGHSEYAPALDNPMLVLTCFGLTDRYVPTGGARPGDRILVTKSAAIEGTAILATDFPGRLEDVPPSVVERAETFYDDVSVVEDAAAVSEYAHAMHDPTEGGLVDGLLEMAVASGATLDVDPDAIPVRDETAALCRAAGVDPLRTFASGALIAAVPEASLDEAAAALRERDVPHSVVGTVRRATDPSLVLGEQTYTDPIRDDMYALWE